MDALELSRNSRPIHYADGSVIRWTGIWRERIFFGQGLDTPNGRPNSLLSSTNPQEFLVRYRLGAGNFFIHRPVFPSNQKFDRNRSR
jgi:hypothetical protein